MKKWLLLSLLIPWTSFGAFTEFYCQSGGSNVNSGSTTSNSAAYTATNGGWNSGTGVFTPVSGNPSASVNVGDFASVYTDGATATGFVGRVTATSSTTLTVSITAKSGTIPTTAGTGISCKVGGAWKGPNGADGWPLSGAAGTMINAAGDPLRINMKNDATYSITAGISNANPGITLFQGYTTTPGDLGKATLDGGTSGASYSLITFTGLNQQVADMIFAHNGATGGTTAVSMTSNGALAWRCVVHDVRGGGIVADMLIECEAYNCQLNAGSSQAAFQLNLGNSFAYRCIAHDNTAANAAGFRNGSSGSIMVDCIAESNTYGFLIDAGSASANKNVYINCDAYNNSSDGFHGFVDTRPLFVYLENCNMVKNGGWGFNGNTRPMTGQIVNCAFGSGSQANTSGDTTSLSGMILTNSTTYASGVTPWIDPANGDFRINLTAAKGAGRGVFTQTAASYSGTVAYPDIGSAQHLEGASGSGFFIGLLTWPHKKEFVTNR